MSVFNVNSLIDLKPVAEYIIKKLDTHDIVLLNGDMGAGKTTLVGEVLRQLEVDDEISSPTFAIVNIYKSKSFGELNHFDFYRIENEEEAIYSGLYDQLHDGNKCFVEWGEKIPNLLPDNYVEVDIEIVDINHRKITIL